MDGSAEDISGAAVGSGVRVSPDDEVIAGRWRRTNGGVSDVTHEKVREGRWSLCRCRTLLQIGQYAWKVSSRELLIFYSLRFQSSG